MIKNNFFIFLTCSFLTGCIGTLNLNSPNNSANHVPESESRKPVPIALSEYSFGIHRNQINSYTNDRVDVGSPFIDGAPKPSATWEGEIEFYAYSTYVTGGVTNRKNKTYTRTNIDLPFIVSFNDKTITANKTEDGWLVDVKATWRADGNFIDDESNVIIEYVFDSIKFDDPSASRYTSERFEGRIGDKGAIATFGFVGDCTDNSACMSGGFKAYAN